MNLKYTLCFCRSGDAVLMLYRYNPPNQYRFNGVGGKLHRGETPRECVIREVKEETGISLDDVRFSGIVTWDGAPETGAEGMYVYVADILDGDYRRYMPPMDCDEGMLGWMPIDEVMTNHEVVDNIPCFIQPMLNGEVPMRYHCHYAHGELQTVSPMPCPELKGV